MVILLLMCLCGNFENGVVIKLVILLLSLYWIDIKFLNYVNFYFYIFIFVFGILLNVICDCYINKK